MKKKHSKEIVLLKTALLERTSLSVMIIVEELVEAFPEFCNGASLPLILLVNLLTALRAVLDGVFHALEAQYALCSTARRSRCMMGLPPIE